MITWSNRHSLASGLALILVTNAIALSGAAYNRSGSPESELVLTERELHLPYAWGHNEENSGIELTLQWRLPVAETDTTYYSRYGDGAPAWLDKHKLESLDFELHEIPADPDAIMHHRLPRTKEVFLVLELDGPDYKKALERAQQHAARATTLAEANPGNKKLHEEAKEAEKGLTREKEEYSRLFIIDAGLDTAALRATYPDRMRYAILRGKVRPQLISHEKNYRFAGYIDSLTNDKINVPLDFKKAFEHSRRQYAASGNDSLSRYNAKVAFGKRLEPWLVAASN